MKKVFLIIDANSLIHRAYHALPPLTDSSSAPAGALYGLSSMLLKILKEISPDYAVAAFDRPEPTFRDKIYLSYKAHRPKTASDLVSQLIASRDFFKAFGLAYLDCAGYEADDIIGTVASYVVRESDIDSIIILSGDLDILQLVEGDRVVAWTPQQGISSFTKYGREEVIKRFGVPPEYIPDFKGLVGDSSDNIPGVQGVGPKTAAMLIKNYGSLEDLYDLSPTPKTTALQNVINNKESALLSKKLATISRDAPIFISALSDFKVIPFAESGLSSFLLSKGFRNLAERAGRL